MVNSPALGLASNVDQIAGANFFHEGCPPNLQAEILRAVGFSESALADILLESGCGGLSHKFYAALLCGAEESPRRDELLEEWRQKLDLLAHQGHHMGIKSSVDIFKVNMKNRRERWGIGVFVSLDVGTLVCL